jgi:predicted porin
VAKYHLLDLGQIKSSFVVFGDLRMKKSLLALAALSAFATAAQAQSSVTVYGVLDTGYGQTTEDRKTSSATTSIKSTSSGTNGQASGTRLGFRGTEDLGGGTKANFVVEFGLDTTEAAPNMNNRQGWVGASGNFGEVRLGRQDSFIKTLNDRYTANSGATFNVGYMNQGFSNAQARHLGYWADAGGVVYSRNNLLEGSALGRVSNAITYISPKFSGFTANVSYTDGTVSDSSKDNKDSEKGLVIGLDFVSGPFTAAYAHLDAERKASTVAAADVRGANGMLQFIGNNALQQTGTDDANQDLKSDTFAASYDFGVATALVIHNKFKSPFKLDAASEINQKRDDTTVGVRVPFGKVILQASYSEGEIEKGASDKWDVEGYQVGAVYNLSKRTNVYAFYGDQEVKAKSGNAGKAIETDGFVLGLRHSF